MKSYNVEYNVCFGIGVGALSNATYLATPLPSFITLRMSWWLLQQWMKITAYEWFRFFP